MNCFTPLAAKAAFTGLLAAAITGCAPAVPAEGPAVIPELAGRTAGAPQRCVPTQQTGALRIADGGTVLYGTGRTIWANRLATRCLGMDRNQILIVEPFGSQYCHGDRVRTLDPISLVPGPACILGDFVPYSR